MLSKADCTFGWLLYGIKPGSKKLTEALRAH